MEGVIVSAKKDGSPITISVITNAQGRYSFPAARRPGRYSLQIRAVGSTSKAPKNADVAAGQPASADLKLRKTPQPQQAAHQCRVDDERPRHR